ncbi:MAG: ABC transporter permease [Ignisphaera sp.]|nr:ABC transporter permease [Ignisphaera sp.]MCX8167604.1 ABC transporter permease [Ignisphaera sp.]MDW8085424.1 ABC transporter permease [Ignisphaera sp.]
MKMPSLNYIIKRIATAFFVVLGVLMLTYVLIYFSPGNPAYTWAGRPRGPKAEEAIKAAEEELGLNKPLYLQIYTHINRFFKGDWGLSLRFKQPVLLVVTRNLVASLELLVVAFSIAIPLGIILGVVSALYRGYLVDKVLYVASLLLISFPRFWIAILFYVFLQMLGVNLFGRIAPSYMLMVESRVGSYIIDSLISGRVEIFADTLMRALPPAVIVALYPMALTIRVIRFSISEKLHEEYVRQAMSYGLSRSKIVYRYALRGVIPAISQLHGITFAYSIVDTATVENIFGRDGIGSAIVKAIPYNDYPLIIGLLAVSGILFIVVNTVSDIIQVISDPRVRI